jgi:SAM-dependent methyltransferase
MSIQIAQFEQLRGEPIRGRHLLALDIGAGIGKGMIALKQAGFDTYGLEPSASFRRNAIERMAIAPERLLPAAVEEASFEGDAFDFINLGAVMEHLYDPSAVIQRAMTWLKPGGLMYVAVPSSSYLMSTLMRLFYRTTGSDYAINLCPMHVPYHLYEFTPTSFALHARQHGYRVVVHEFYACTAYVPRWLDVFFVKMMDLTNTGMMLTIWLQKD